MFQTALPIEHACQVHLPREVPHLRDVHRRAPRARARTTAAGAAEDTPRATTNSIEPSSRTIGVRIASIRSPVAERRDAAPTTRPQIEAPQVVEPFVLRPVEPRLGLADDRHHAVGGVEDGREHRDGFPREPRS
jgi:hypothetical protein